MRGSPGAMGAILCGALLSACTPATDARPTGPDVSDAGAEGRWYGPAGGRVIYVPTQQIVVDEMLERALVVPGDVLFDLGCGDGRIVVTAAKRYGIRAVGFDLDPERVREARENVVREGVEDRVTIRQQDIYTVDLSSATVVALYLRPDMNLQLVAQIDAMPAGARIVSHNYDIAGVEPDGHWTLPAPNFVSDAGRSAYRGPDVPEDLPHYGSSEQQVYLWVTPLRKKNDLESRAAVRWLRDGPDVPFFPTPAKVVDEMLSVANVGPGDRRSGVGALRGRCSSAAAGPGASRVPVAGAAAEEGRVEPQAPPSPPPPRPPRRPSARDPSPSGQSPPPANYFFPKRPATPP